MDEDVEWLRQYAENGTEEPFRALVQARLGQVYSAALRQTRNSALAEDAAQRVFVALAKNARVLSRRSSLVGWLHQSAHHAAVDLIRAEERRKRREFSTVVMADPSTQVDPDWDEARSVLDAALAELSDTDRSALLLRFFDGRTLAQVGAALQLSENAARMRVERALEKLRRGLRRKGITSTLLALEATLSHAPATTVPARLAAAVMQASLESSGAAIASTSATAALLMSTSKLSLAAAAVLLLAAIGFSGYEFAAQRQAQHALVVSNQRLAQSRSVVRPAPAPSAATPPTTADATAEWDPRAEGDAFLGRHPEVKTALAAAFRAQYASFYAPLFKRLALSQAAIDRFLDLTIGMHGRSFPFGPGGKLITLYPAEGLNLTQLESAYHDLLGDPAYSALQTYDNAAGARYGAEQAAAAMVITQSPLTTDQANQLYTLMAAQIVPGTISGEKHFDWDGILAGAGAFLNSGQLAALGVMRSQVENSWNVGHIAVK